MVSFLLLLLTPYLSSSVFAYQSIKTADRTLLLLHTSSLTVHQICGIIVRSALSGRAGNIIISHWHLANYSSRYLEKIFSKKLEHQIQRVNWKFWSWALAPINYFFKQKACWGGTRETHLICLTAINVAGQIQLKLTCLLHAGLAEINTVFVIGRRYFSRNKHGGRIFNFLHWLSFIPLRFILFPILIFVFWQSLSGFPLWKKFWVCGAQVFLCVFNALFLHTILTRHKFYDTLKATLTGWDLDKPTTGP